MTFFILVYSKNNDFSIKLSSSSSLFPLITIAKAYRKSLLSNEKKRSERTHADRHKEKIVLENSLESFSLTSIHHHFFLFYPHINIFCKTLAFNVMHEKRDDEEKKKNEENIRLQLKSRKKCDVV